MGGWALGVGAKACWLAGWLAGCGAGARIKKGGRTRNMAVIKHYVADRGPLLKKKESMASS
ncbi:uncharacterized protein THITE_2106884 [Thermothielavioides terrestris NRRL 8126]|uniref:Uncharacterized protein n=1 Tax=Thermothielavioides terrestris (strain ATCC 38088 / NRRL 8126) TaxID=578455 RepID=G2QRY1_THETT|nr:uncharacterized protein THITE_2106884 [Thermothielavioides terrestris NRRL 8126]AEO62568.1 hypothetical protein THITE_2106884 [Thermothielavioides terrestris NRRL 8126]